MRYRASIKEMAKPAGLAALKVRLGGINVLLSLAQLAPSAPASSPKTAAVGAPSTSGPHLHKMMMFGQFGRQGLLKNVFCRGAAKQRRLGEVMVLR